jgi:aryl-alcohol dehydrogenase-like predicted oxidoreductase
MSGGTDEQESIRTIRSAFDHGITLIDTARVYGFGRSEEIVGQALAEGGLRQRTVLATKFGLDWHGSQPLRDASARRIFKEIEASLKRLRTNVIDILPGALARLSKKPRLRWERSTSRERFERLASATFRRSR